jgi:hypothetical protein
MYCRKLTAASVLFIALAGSVAAQDRPTVKTADTPPPDELGAPIRALLDTKALTVFDAKGKLLCTIWPRKVLESSAAANQVQSGLTYRELDESVIVGAVRFPDVWTDYRKQKIKAGTYTLRLGFQPMDGDHQGTAPFNEFCLLAPARRDEKPDKMEPKALQQLSAGASGGSHPGVMLLFPSPKPSTEPSVEAKPNETWVLNFPCPVMAGGQKSILGFGLVVIGHSASE